MGCCVSKSTYTSYITQLANLTKQADDMEEEMNSRRCLNNLNVIDPTDSLSYLQYQEQMRANKFIENLAKVMRIPATSGQAENLLMTPSDYFKQRLQQTDYVENVTEKFNKVANKLEEIHKIKTIEFNERLEILQEFIKEKVKHSEPKIEELLDEFHSIQEYSSLNELTEGLIKLSELQKELEILHRKYDFKHFLLMQEAKNKEKESMRVRIEEIKVHIEKLNSNWADMKDEQRKKAEEMQSLQDTITLNKEKIINLTEKQEELKETLKQYGENAQSYDETQNTLNEKRESLNQLLQEIDELNEKVSQDPHDHTEMEALKKRKSFLAGEVGELNSQIEYLADLQRRANEESAKKNEEEMKLRITMIKELQEEIESKSQQMQKIDQIYVNDLRNQVSINIIQKFKEIPKQYLWKWKLNASKKGDKKQDNSETKKTIFSIMNKVKIETSWEKPRLIGFFNKLVSEKYKKDEQLLKENKLPLPVHEFLEGFLKNLYEDQWEIQCKMMLNTLMSDTNNELFASIRSMIGLSKDNFSYYFSLFLIEALHYFDMNKTHSTETVSFENVANLVESFTENKREVMIPVLYGMKSETMKNEDYVLYMLKLKLGKLGKQFTDYCDSADSFMDVAKTDFELLVDDKILQQFKDKCEQEFDMNFDMKIDVSINTLVMSKFQVTKSRYVSAFVDAYKEYRLKATQILEKLVSPYEILTEEIFNNVINQISEGLSPDIISSLFSEAIMSSSDVSSIKSVDFVAIIMKYAVGGFGIGPFRFTKLQSLSNSLLNTLNKSRKSEELKKIMKPKDLPIKIFQATEIAEDPTIATDSRLLRAGTIGKKLGQIRKSASPNFKSEKNLRKDLPLSPRPPSIGK